MKHIKQKFLQSRRYLQLCSFARADLIAFFLATGLLAGIYANSEMQFEISSERIKATTPFYQDLNQTNDSLVQIARVMGIDSVDLFAADWIFDREYILNDTEGRISEEFHIPANMRERVGFWFDVYTKWDSHQRVIHHSRRPWIVFQVVEVKDIIEASHPRRLWMRKERAQDHVRREATKIREAIESLAKRSTMENLSDTEQLVANALLKLGGDIQEQAQAAIGHVRVQTGQKNFIIDGLVTSGRYLGTMEEIFRDNALPVELTRLPFVESSFNRRATSKVGAAGIWQFMRNTGRKFMTVTENIDERRSPLKSTEAAAKLLRENHRILYGEWPLAITAWNHGPGGVRLASRTVGSRDMGVIVENFRTRRFDTASSNFYAEFLAALHAERYSDLAYPPIHKDEPLNVHRVKLAKGIRINSLIKESGLTAEEFLDLNPDLVRVARRNLVIPRGFKIHIPAATPPGIESLIVRETPKPRTQAGRS